MIPSTCDPAATGRVVDQIYRDFCQVKPDANSTDMLRQMLGAPFAGIQAMPVSSRYSFQYLVQAGFEYRPWVHSKVCALSKDARWDVTGADQSVSSEIRTFDIFERLPGNGAGGQLRSYFDHIGVRHAIMTSCLSDHGWQYVMFAGRSPGQQAFDSSERERLNAIVPHFRSALRARTRLVASQGMAETCAAGMERLGVGVVVINGRGQTTYLNTVAERIIASKDGLVNNPRFGAISASANQSLQNLIRAAARDDWRGGGVAMAVARRSGAGNYELIVDAQPSPLGISRNGGVVIYLRDRSAPRAHAIEAELLQDLLDLTEAEALVACAAANGRSTQEIAEELGIQYNTVRAHFRSIYAKRGCNSRSDLVQMVLNSPATLGEYSRARSNWATRLS